MTKELQNNSTNYIKSHHFYTNLSFKVAFIDVLCSVALLCAKTINIDLFWLSVCLMRMDCGMVTVDWTVGRYTFLVLRWIFIIIAKLYWNSGNHFVVN